MSDLQTLNKCLNDQENFLILLVNIRSLNSNFELLEVFIENLNYKPNIIICTETCQLTQCNFFNLQGYSLHYNYCNLNRADGVVVIK